MTNTGAGRGRRLATVLLVAAAACVGGNTRTREMSGALPGEPIPDSAFAALSARISEPSGYFDTDNLISNETGYLKVLEALERIGGHGGAYAGVGPDQNFSYIAAIEPKIAFIIDIRRDNLLQQLLFKALFERAPTRIQFLAGLLGRPAPDTVGWRARGIDDIVAYLDTTPADSATVRALRREIEQEVRSYNIPLDSQDLETTDRFHSAFVRAGMGLRFTSTGRAPRPYYPTYRQLVTETDMEGHQTSYLSTSERYAAVRSLELDNRVIPVVGDLAGDHAVKELGSVLREMGLELTVFYTSNVEFYLWREAAFPQWAGNVEALPTTANAVIIRSYFPNFGGQHPSAIPGYWATQTLQPVRTLEAGGFSSYFDLVTRDAIDLRASGEGR